MKKKLFRYIPIIILEVYLLITIILFEFGAINYPVENRGKLYIFIALYQLFLFLGYYVSCNKNKLKLFKKNDTKKSEFKLEFSKGLEIFIMIMLILSIFYSYMWMARYTNSFSVVKIFKQVLVGFVNPGLAYKENLNMVPGKQLLGKLPTVTSTLLVAFYYVGIPLGIYYFKKLNIVNKILVIIAIVLEILSYVIKGTNIGIFRVCVVCSTILLLKYFTSKKEYKKERKRERKRASSSNIKKIGFIGIVLIMALFVVYFTHSTTNRMNNELPKTIYGLKVDPQRGIFGILPDSLKNPFFMIDSYLSQGYYGMSLALEEKFDSTFGVGNSTFLTENIEDILKVDISSKTYINKISDRWDKRVNWSSLYTWYANDFSFYGVVIIMAIFGFMLFKVIRAALNGNIFAIILIPLYVQICLFIPANNAILANPMTFMPFVFWHFAWFIRYLLRRKCNFEEDPICIKKLLSKFVSFWKPTKKTGRRTLIGK